MKDIQNTPQESWNDWSKLVLTMIQRFDEDIKNIKEELKDSEICSNTKLNKDIFETFLKEDYIIFKTKLLTKASVYGSIAGLIVGSIVSIIIAVLKDFVLK